MFFVWLASLSGRIFYYDCNLMQVIVYSSNFSKVIVILDDCLLGRERQDSNLRGTLLREWAGWAALILLPHCAAFRQVSRFRQERRYRRPIQSGMNLSGWLGRALVTLLGVPVCGDLNSNGLNLCWSTLRVP